MAISLDKKIDVRNKLIVICIPTYNEEKNIAKVIIDAKKYSDNIIVIDDGSTDYTPQIAQGFGVKLIRHDKNLGKGAALRTGFIHALLYSPDVVVTIDGDGQHNPHDIPKLVKPVLEEECDVVIGSRSDKTKMPKYRKIGFDIISFLNNKATKIKIKDTQSGFRAYSKKSIDVISQGNFQDYSAEFEQIKLLAEKGFNITEVPIKIKYYGVHKTSKKNFLTHGGELILSSLFMIISRRPIMYLALPGSIFLFIGLFFAFFTLFLFNAERYFSIPMSILSGGFLIIGSLLILSSMFIYIIAKMQTNSQNYSTNTFFNST